MLRERLDVTELRQILAFDGGGIRGALAIGYLERIEAVLRDRHDRSNVVLRTCFDLIGGSSSGSIIVAGPGLPT